MPWATFCHCALWLITIHTQTKISTVLNSSADGNVCKHGREEKKITLFCHEQLESRKLSCRNTHACTHRNGFLFAQPTDSRKKRLKLISSCFPSWRNMNVNHKAYRQINRQCLLVPQYFSLCKKSCLLHCFGNHAASINGCFQHVLSPLLGHGNFSWMALRISQFWAERSIIRELLHIHASNPVKPTWSQSKGSIQF